MIFYQAIVALLLTLFLAFVLKNLRDYAPLTHSGSPLRPEESLYVLIPARNEAENIEACLSGLLNQEWGSFHILVLDDSSDDGTGEIVARMAQADTRIDLIAGTPLPPGWAGKVWACSRLGEEALRRGADWLLFLDADTRSQPKLIQTLLHHAQQTGAGMVSTFPYQVTGSFWEQLVLPMLHFLITTFLPIRMVWESPFPGLVAACGQVELFSANAYRAIGGHGAISASFHDGLQLARRTKAAGLPVRLFDGSRLIRCRMYAGGRAVWSGFTRNAYEGLGSPAALITMTGLQVWLFLSPYLFVGVAAAQWFGRHAVSAWGVLACAQLALIIAIRGVQSARFGHRAAPLLHPLSIVALVAIQWASFWKAKTGAPIAWKGRAYTPHAG